MFRGRFISEFDAWARFSNIVRSAKTVCHPKLLLNLHASSSRSGLEKKCKEVLYEDPFQLHTAPRRVLINS